MIEKLFPPSRDKKVAIFKKLFNWLTGEGEKPERRKLGNFRVRLSGGRQPVEEIGPYTVNNTISKELEKRNLQPRS